MYAYRYIDTYVLHMFINYTCTHKHIINCSYI